MNDQIKPTIIEKPLAGQSPILPTPISSATTIGQSPVVDPKPFNFKTALDRMVEGKKITNGQSPVVDPKPFNFKTALDRMIEGKKITKLEWNNADYGFIHKPSAQLQIFREMSGKKHTWILCEGDILGEDYVIVK